MRIYFTQVPNINSSISFQDVVSAYITQKLDDGYMVNIGGTEVFARCLLDLKVGEFLKLKPIESSSSQIVFKVINHEMEAQDVSDPSTRFDLPQAKEVQTAFKLLAKLNLPITKARVDLVTKLLAHFTKNEGPEHSMPFSNEPPPQNPVSSPQEALSNNTESNFNIFENQPPELPENLAVPRQETDFSSDKALPESKTDVQDLAEHLDLTRKLPNHLTSEGKYEHYELLSKELSVDTLVSFFQEIMAPHLESEFDLTKNSLLEHLAAPYQEVNLSSGKGLSKGKTKAQDLIEHLVLKAVSILHSEDPLYNVCFFALHTPLPIFQNIYLKISRKGATGGHPESLGISFIVSTKNLGSILIDLKSTNGTIAASSTFEDKKAMNAVKNYLNAREDIPSFIKTMELKTGKVSKRDFFFGDIKMQPRTVSINIKV